MKKQIGILIILFLAGVASAQLVGTEFLTTYGFLNKFHMNAFATRDIDHIQLFWNVLWERGKEWMILVIIEVSPIKKYLPWLVKAFLTYALGLFICACVINVGWLGIVFAISSLMPQIVPYVFAIILFFRLDKQSKTLKRYVLKIIVIVMLIIGGCLLEATAGAWILQKMIKIIC